MNDMNVFNEISFKQGGAREPIFVDLESEFRGQFNGCTVQNTPAESSGETAEEAEKKVSPKSVVDIPRIERAVREILLAIGEDPDRDGLRETPRRVARAYRDIFSGITDNAARHLQTQFEHESHQAVVVSGIDFNSTCEHHLLPFRGQAHIAYLPQKHRVVGLSKLARTVDVFSRRPQLQERLTEQIADALHEHLCARGVLVLLEAEHFCMTLRGACKPGAVTTTLAARGLYQSDARARGEILSLMNRTFRGLRNAAF